MVLGLAISQFAWGDVTGKKAEVLGNKWTPSSFKDWVISKDALIVPEVSNLAIQACLRKTQMNIDVLAYQQMREIIEALKTEFRRDNARRLTLDYDYGLNSLTQLLVAIDSIQAEDPEKYETACRSTLERVLPLQAGKQPGSRTIKEELEVLYFGRMRPQISPSLSAEDQALLAKLFAKGLKLANLEWPDLKDQICKLEGYYSTSLDPSLWKFFSTSRAMMNVLPKPEDTAKFIASISRAERVPQLVRNLNEYSSVAGKYNGASVGMTDEEVRKAKVRLTGPALGSIQPSLMAFFTTGWREELQRRVIDQDYPAKPFQLISAQNVLESLGATPGDLVDGSHSSATILGMKSGWRSLHWWFAKFEVDPPQKKELGPNTEAYRKTAALAWLALNAETNIRQNEKIAGIKATSEEQEEFPTTAVFGNQNEYEMLVAELDAAVKAYRLVDTEGTATQPCVSSLRKMNEAAVKALGAESSLAQLAPADVAFLQKIEFVPVIADLGLEVDDEVGQKPEGVHRLHLAIGYGRKVEVSVNQKMYTVWTPTAMVLHLPKITSTAEWQRGGVVKYEKLED